MFNKNKMKQVVIIPSVIMYIPGESPCVDNRKKDILDTYAKTG